MKSLLHCPLVARLKDAESQLLQILLTKFALARRGNGTVLKIHFDRNTPAIRLRDGKTALRNWIKEVPNCEDKAADYQAELDRFLIEGQGKHYRFTDSTYPFRYVSGGTLPVVRRGSKDYYVFFYRDVFPIGWNLSNGGSDTREELLHPNETIERELREELFVVDLKKEAWYSFTNEEEETFLERAEHTAARRLWEQKIREETPLNLTGFQSLTIPLKWMKGPDRLRVRYGEKPAHTTRDCYVTIAAEDFGIEIDRVAKMTVGEDALLLDGEVYDDRLLNRPVGLFEVDQLNEAVKSGSRCFVPDLFFHGLKGKLGGWKAYANGFWKHMGFRPPEQVEDFMNCKFKSDLCPVAKRMIQRQLQQIKTDKTRNAARRAASKGTPEVFISYHGRDKKYAQQVYRFVTEHLGRRAFLYTEGTRQSHFKREIETALEASQHFISVGSSAANLYQQWPRYECDVFHNEILNGTKKQAQIISFITGFRPTELPLPQRNYNAIVFDRFHPKASLLDLKKHFPARPAHAARFR